MKDTPYKWTTQPDAAILHGGVAVGCAVNETHAKNIAHVHNISIREVETQNRALLAALKDAVEMQESAFDELKAHLSPASKSGWLDKIAKHKAAIAAAEPKADWKG